MTNPINIFSAVLGFKTNQEKNAIKTQNFAISQATSGYRNPFWVCRHPLADVSFPESFMSNWVLSGNTGAQTAGTAHTHSIPLDVNTVAGPLGSGLFQYDSRGAFITISQTTVMDTVGVWLTKSVGSINNVYMEVFKENPDASLTMYSSTDISASLSTSFAFVEVPISGGLIVQAGERWLVRVRNSSSVSNTMSMASIIRVDQLSPKAAFYTSGSSLTAQSSYTSGQAGTALGASLLWPFVMLAATGLASTDRNYSDDFYRSTLGGLWLTKSNTSTNQLGISGNKVAFTGSTNGDQNAVYTNTTNGDDAIVTGTISDSLFAVTGAYMGLLLHSNADMSSLVYLAVNNAGAKIYSGSSTSLTQRATITRVFNEGVWSLQYDTATTTYTALLDGDDVGLTWNDSGAAKPRGGDYRYGGMRISRVTAINAGMIDNWSLADRTM